MTLASTNNVIDRIQNKFFPMKTAPNLTTGKNELWDAYKAADVLVRDEIVLELKKVDMWRHFQVSACKQRYNLKKPKAPLRDVFVRLLPETAHLFGLKSPPKASRPRKQAEPEGTLRLFE